MGASLAALAAPLLLAAGGLAAPPRSEVNRPWPFFEPAEPEEPPVRAPLDALKTFAMPPGYALELVAAEPLVQDPILMEFDGDGRLWVMELPGWAHNLSMDNSLEPVNRLVVLDDTDGDGAFDKRTVFADGLVLPRAFKVLAGGCALIGEPPTLWKACDTNGDLKADTKDKVTDGFARLGVLEHGANGLFWGMDNRLVVSEHEWNLAYRAGQFVTVPGLRRGQWGVTQDDAGRIYRNVNTDPLFVDYVSPDYYARNPDLVRTRGLYENLVDQEKTNIWPAHPTFGLNRGYRREVFREDGTASYYGGVSSPLIYRGTRLPAEVQGMAFVADGATNIVHLLRLKDDGEGRKSAEDFYAKGEFLASTDVRFRPTALAGGPDGTIYIADMYRGVSQDGPLQTDYLRDYITKRGLQRGTGHGRIYRVVHVGTGGAGAAMPRDARPRMSQDATAVLVQHLSHPNGWWRDTAQQLLVQRADPQGLPLLRKLALERKADWRSRLHALWTLHGLEGLQPAQIRAALADPRPELRAAGLRLAEPWLARGDKAISQAALALAGDGSWQVRVQLAASLGALPAERRTAPMVALLRAQGNDAVLVDAALSGLKGDELAVLTALAEQAEPPREALAMLAGALAKRRDPGIARLVAMAGDGQQPGPVRRALLDGLALGLAGGVQGGGNAVAGGRAGGNIPGVTRQRAGGNRFDLAAEPHSLTLLASSKDALAEPARRLLALVNWPGRPAPPALPPRSAVEEALFQRGQAIYVEQCSGCHQAQGQGQPRVAAALAGSKRAVASGDVPVRILTNGLEGSIGLMPPLGAAMSDEDVAAVLTFVRQSWGNTGTPLPPAAVKEWRLAFAHRTTPWSEKDIDAPQR
ncbi:c-type cytochrome [Novosphingobium piscinae]|uniref:C-type cytochrome n=1 Tax=Novosphingobium piscinae TaxID=1507448 RepID=A0A7X1FZB2_9SPHN|nr:c-type cytochrome [Novosphingobium piscinae]MBC2669769.1 c-type cytochrome [Novosphingobium piscinae]